MNFYGDDLYPNDSYEKQNDKIYTGEEIFDEFLTYLTDYILEFDRIIIENGENMFIVYHPKKDKKQNYVFFEGREGSPRHSGTAESIEELLEEALSVVGEEKIKLKQKGKSI